MSAARDFLLMAKVGDEPTSNTEPYVGGQGTATFWKMCVGDCADFTPHVRKEDYTECVVCGCRTYAKKDARS